MNIALLSTAPVANQREFISGVFPNNQDHRIQFIVEDYEANLTIDSHSNTSFASNQHKVFFRYFFDANEINIQTRFFAEVYQRVLQTGPTKDRHITWWQLLDRFPISFVRRQVRRTETRKQQKNPAHRTQYS